MFSLKLTGLIALLICDAAVYADPPRLHKRVEERVLDVAMNPESIVEGYLIDPFGKVLKETTVTLVQNRKVIWTGRTDANGQFQVKGVPCGVYRIDSDNISTNCRIWSNDSAPPRASSSLLLTKDVPSSKGTTDHRNDELTIRFSGFSTLTIPRMPGRDVRKLISP